MGVLVSKLAFPVPDREYSERSLRAQGDRLVFLTIPQTGHQIPAIHLERNDTDTPFTILYSHGNAEDVGLGLYLLQRMSQVCQADVFAYEYPGYSISQGKPSERNCYLAIQTAFNYLVEERGIDPSTIVVFGRSLGSGPTVDLASQVPNLAGCILQSPLESGVRCVIGGGPCTTLTLSGLDIFCNYAKVEKISCPVFILHGEADTVVPVANGKALYQQLTERPNHSKVAYDPVWIPRKGHNDMPQEKCFQLSGDFLQFLQSPTQHRERQERQAAQPI